jgi:16S rRNA (adenine1518-N6/adenine1519-N6)-dimethyltransferase
MLQAYCRVTPLFKLPPGAFRPPPKVDSAVVRMVPLPREDIAVHDRKRFQNVVRAAFGQRRKTLRNALMGTCTTEQIEAAGLRADARAEQVEVEGFVRLANGSAAGAGE